MQALVFLTRVLAFFAVVLLIGAAVQCSVLIAVTAALLSAMAASMWVLNRLTRAEAAVERALLAGWLDQLASGPHDERLPDEMRR